MATVEDKQEAAEVAVEAKASCLPGFVKGGTLDSETNTSNDGKVKKFSANSDTVDRKIHIRTGGTQDQLNGLFYLLGTTVT